MFFRTHDLMPNYCYVGLSDVLSLIYENFLCFCLVCLACLGLVISLFCDSQECFINCDLYSIQSSSIIAYLPMGSFFTSAISLETYSSSGEK